MTISTADCKNAICTIINGSNGGTVLAEAYNGAPNISEFLKHCWMCDQSGNQIPANTIADVIKQAGNVKNWKRIEKEKAHGPFSWGDPPGAKWRRGFDCRPFDDQLRAYVWDDGNQIIKVQIMGE
jgi:hypothetical protein